MRFIVLFTALLFVAVMPLSAQAQQTAVPTMPTALEALTDKGAQARYLGKSHGLDGWIVIYQGQEQYYYVTPDGQGFLMGLLFNKDGEIVTVKQVADLQKQGGEVLDFLAADKPPKSLAEEMEKSNKEFEYKTPAEQMFAEVENSNYVSFGKKDAPVIYSFMDPQCPHCHEFMQDMRKDYIEKGLVQVRMIPVGFRDETLTQAAFLLASPDAEERWFKHLDGDEQALPAKSGISTQGVQKNLALMQAWKFNVTPMTAYRGRDGSVKIVRGRASDLTSILADLPTAQ